MPRGIGLSLGLACDGNVSGSGPAPPVNTVLPSITGTATEGQTLTASAGTWTGSPTYSYQWERAGAAIDGATASTYLLVSADVGSTITVTVTATNAGGSARATSAATATVASMYLLRDTFTDSDGTALASHTMDVGGGWSYDKGAYQISGGVAGATADGGTLPKAALAGAGVSDYDVSADCVSTRTTDRWGGIAVRGTDRSNCWVARFYAYASTLAIFEVSGGAFTLRASSAYSPASGARRLRLVCVGASLTASVDGSASTNYASAKFNQSATLCGILPLYTSDDGYDNFTVTA